MTESGYYEIEGHRGYQPEDKSSKSGDCSDVCPECKDSSKSPKRVYKNPQFDSEQLVSVFHSIGFLRKDLLEFYAMDEEHGQPHGHPLSILDHLERKFTRSL